MPIDFKALMNLSSEERQANAERSRLEFEAQMKDRIATRQQELAHITRAMESNGGAFSKWDHDFIGDLSGKAQQRDISGYEGGYLMDLSSSQTSQIERIKKIANDVIGMDDQAQCATQDSSATNDAPPTPEKRKGFRLR